jgi:hypothetical protein
MKITNFWNVAPCSPIEIYKPFAPSPGYDGGSSTSKFSAEVHGVTTHNTVIFLVTFMRTFQERRGLKRKFSSL